MKFYGIRCLSFLGIILMVSFSPSAQLLRSHFHPVAEVGEIMTHQHFCALTTKQGTLSSLSCSSNNPREGILLARHGLQAHLQISHL